MVEGIEYSEYKIYSKSVDVDSLLQRLTAAGAVHKKPEIPIEIPDRPQLLNEEILNKQRFEYRDEILEKDKKIASGETFKSLVRNVFTIIFVGAFVGFIGMELLIPKLKVVELLPENFITAKGNYIVYDYENRMVVFKLADNVEDIGYDSTCSVMISETAEVRRDVTVERLVTTEEEIIYDRGNRIIDFEPDPSDYGFVNGNPFMFDAYGDGTESDWSDYGELERGNAENIILRGIIVINEGQYLFGVGRSRAVLGEYSEDIEPFYESLNDEKSRAAILYSLNRNKPIVIYGQIQKTLTRNEGRNTLQRLIFNFKTDYARQR
ncbi:hypothetical protein ACFL6I_17440 [candidate division KSB1 bacterium]